MGHRLPRELPQLRGDPAPAFQGRRRPRIVGGPRHAHAAVDQVTPVTHAALRAGGGRLLRARVGWRRALAAGVGGIGARISCKS